MVKKKPKKTLTLDEKIKAVLTEDQMKQPVKEKAEEMEVDEVRVQRYYFTFLTVGTFRTVLEQFLNP